MRGGPGRIATPARGNRGPKDGAGGERARGPTSALEELMRRRGVDEAWSALEEMQAQGTTTDKYTVSRMLMKTVGDGRAKLNPARVYRGIALVERFIDIQPRDVDEVLFNALLDACCRLKDLGRLESIVGKMHELKVTPSPVTLGILVKTYGQAGDLQKVLQVWTDMEKQRGQANAVTYGCMIDACVKCGHMEKAVEIFKGMRDEGKHRNTILYTTLIKGYGLEKDLVSALELFRQMPEESVPYNAITFNSILDVCVKCGDLPTAEGLLREMIQPESGLEPDLITFSTLLKGYCHAGNLDKALQVVEAIKARGLRCDELVYNTLMDGCVKANDVAAGVGLFEEMVQSGMRPSAITHSILAKLYQRAGHEEDALEAVAHLYQQHGIERPSGRGDMGKGAGRRPRPRSPGRESSALGSPSAASGRGLYRERSDSGMSEGLWSSFSRSMPASAEPSAPSSAAGSLQGSPVHSAALYLPLDALRHMPVPPMPGVGAPDGSPQSQASFTHVGPLLPASLASVTGSVPGSVVGSPCGSPHGMEQQGFGMPMQPMFGLYGTHGTHPVPSPQMQLPCGGGFMATGPGMGPPSMAPGMPLHAMQPGLSPGDATAAGWAAATAAAMQQQAMQQHAFAQGLAQGQQVWPQGGPPAGMPMGGYFTAPVNAGGAAQSQAPLLS